MKVKKLFLIEEMKFIEKHGIKPEKSHPSNKINSIGFSEKEQKWWGWSHRACFGFGIGYEVKKGDSMAEGSEFAPKTAVPVGFKAKTLDDCKRLAIAFADSVA